MKTLRNIFKLSLLLSSRHRVSDILRQQFLTFLEVVPLDCRGRVCRQHKGPEQAVLVSASPPGGQHSSLRTERLEGGINYPVKYQRASSQGVKRW